MLSLFGSGVATMARDTNECGVVPHWAYACYRRIPNSNLIPRFVLSTNEVARIEDVESGEVIFDRNAA